MVNQSANAKPSRRLRFLQVACLCVSLVILLAMSRELLWWMAFVFREPREDMGHGWIVPLFSLALLWRRRRELASAMGAPSLAGLGCVAAGLFLFWVGARGDQVRITQIAAFWLLWSLSYALCGRAVARLTLFPVAYLLFTVPLSFLDIFTVKLRFLTSAIAGALLNGIGIPVLRTGTGLHCLSGEGFNLDVADPCSGMRSIFALLALTGAYAYATQRTLIRKWALFLCAVPVAILGNIVRIFTIAVVAHFCGQKVATGFYHDYSGYVVFLVGVLAIAQLAVLFRRGEKAVAEPAPAVPAPSPAGGWRAVAPLLLVPLLCLATALGLARQPPPEEEPADFVAAVLPPLPDYRPMYPWFCQNEHCGRVVETASPTARPDVCPSCGSAVEAVSLGERTALPPDTGFRKCHYYDALGDVFRITVVINGKSRQSIHRPEVCLPAQGFSMENGRVVAFPLADGTQLPVRCVDLRRQESTGAARMGQGYYFISRDRQAASHAARMMASIRDRAFRNRITRWAMVTVFCEESLTSTPERRQAVAAFLSQFEPALRRSSRDPGQKGETP